MEADRKVMRSMKHVYVCVSVCDPYGVTTSIDKLKKIKSGIMSEHELTA